MVVRTQHWALHLQIIKVRTELNNKKMMSEYKMKCVQSECSDQAGLLNQACLKSFKVVVDPSSFHADTKD